MARPRRGFPHPLQYSAHMPFRVSIPLTAALAAAAMAAASMVAPALAAPACPVAPGTTARVTVGDTGRTMLLHVPASATA